LAVPAAEPLVAVHVEDRHEQEGGGVERLGGDGTLEQLAKDEEAGVLAVDLAAVDAALHQDDRTASLAGGRGVEHAVARGHEREHRPVLGRASELDAADLRRPRLLEACAKRLDLRIAASAGESGLLGHGDERRSRA
jgi:hypothetical protein